MMKYYARYVARLLVFEVGYKNLFEIYAADFAKSAFSNGVIIRGACSISFRLERRLEHDPTKP